MLKCAEVNTSRRLEITMTIDQEHAPAPNLEAPIPELPSIAGWKEVPIRETIRSREPLVPVGIFSDHPRIMASSVYADEHHSSPYYGGLDGSNIAVFMREGVASKIDIAAGLLPRGLHLMVMDAYRSLEVQAALFNQYRKGVEAARPDWSEEQISAETQKYVSIPSTDSSRPSPHNTGASVDVVLIRLDDDTQILIDEIDAKLRTVGEDWEKQYLLEMKRSSLIRRHATMLDFGTRFDHGGPMAALRHFEEKSKTQPLTDVEESQLTNRRLLFNVMVASGMEPYADEWWHFNDPASQMGAKAAGLEFAEYGAAELSEENQAFALMREQHHINSVRLARGDQWIPPEGLGRAYQLALRAVAGDNPKNIWKMTQGVERIEP